MNMSQVPSILAFVYTVRSATAPAASPRWAAIRGDVRISGPYS
jgi:hypothetical protein